jgi:mRNA interferase MazF
MRRGDVWWAALEPTVGGEIGKTRPAVIISNDRSNAQNNRVQVVPVTSQTRRVYPSEALVTVDGGLSKAVADQIRTVDKSRPPRLHGEDQRRRDAGRRARRPPPAWSRLIFPVR